MTVLDTDLKEIMESFSRRLYNVEQRVTSSGIMGTPAIYDEIVIDNGIDPPVVIGATPPAEATDVVVDTGTFYESIFADVEWEEGLVGSDSTLFEVQLFERSAGPSYTFVNIFQTAGLSYRIENLKPNQDYSVKVVSISALGVRGPATPYANFTTGADTTLPPKPDAPTVARGATTIVVKYTPLTPAQAADVANSHGMYEVEADTVVTFDSGNKRSAIGNDQIIAFNDITTPLTYYARVRAIDSSGNAGPWSDPSTSLVAGGVIDAMIVADLNAAKITAGFLDASRIQAGTIAADKLTTGTLSAGTITLSGTGTIQIGGGAPFTGLLLNAAGLRLYSAGVEKVTLDAASGAGTFKGTVDSSTITGSTIWAGANKVLMDSNGICLFVPSPTTWDPTGGIRWRPNPNSGTDLCRLYGVGNDTFQIELPRADSFLYIIADRTEFATTDGYAPMGYTVLGSQLNCFMGIYGGTTDLWGTLQLQDGNIFSTSLFASATANLGVRWSSTSGRIYYQTSSELFKTNIVPLDSEIPTDIIFDFDYVAFDPIRPDGSEEEEGVTRTYGVVLERVMADLEKRKVPDHFFISRLGDGSPVAFMYDQLAIPTIIELRKLRDRVAELEATLTSRST